MNTDNCILWNMISNGLVKKDNIMRVKISKEISMEVERFYNQVYFSDTGAKYLIEVRLINNLGVILYTFRFNEIDAVRILDSIDEFRYEFCAQTYSSMIIQINPMNPRLESPYLFFQWGGVDEIAYDNITSDDYGDIPDILFKIQQYSAVQETYTDLFVFAISENTIDDISFAIFFTSILDIVGELPMNHQSEVESIVTHMFDRGKL